MEDCIKGFGEVKDGNVDLVAFVVFFQKVVYC